MKSSTMFWDMCEINMTFCPDRNGDARSRKLGRLSEVHSRPRVLCLQFHTYFWLASEKTKKLE
ncbi:hypothetical protein V6Z12_D06G007200 [Gossypium hirsutum]